MVSILPLLLPSELPLPATFIFSGSPGPCCASPGCLAMLRDTRGSFQGTEHRWGQGLEQPCSGPGDTTSSLSHSAETYCRAWPCAWRWGAMVREKRPTPCLWSSQSSRRTHRQIVASPEIIIEYKAGSTAEERAAALNIERTLTSECCRMGELGEGSWGLYGLGS